jgi:hypothetical protein
MKYELIKGRTNGDILKVVCESNGVPPQTCYIESVITRVLAGEVIRILVRHGSQPPRPISPVPKAAIFSRKFGASTSLGEVKATL